MEITSENTKTPNRLAYSLKTAAEQVDASVGYLRKEIRAGNLRAKKFGAKVVVLGSDLQIWLESKNDWRAADQD
jgi:excisionase family DNA binding protein